jgi:hypothetical protein
MSSKNKVFVFSTPEKIPYTYQNNGLSYIPTIGVNYRQASLDLLYKSEWGDFKGNKFQVSTFEHVMTVDSGTAWWEQL